jgi:hypothetical protein
VDVSGRAILDRERRRSEVKGFVGYRASAGIDIVELDKNFAVAPRGAPL